MAGVRKAMYFMGVLDDSDIQWLASHATKRFVPAGTTLIREGEPIDSLLIVLDGQLSVTIRSGLQVAQLGSGEILGEISFLDSRPPLATVTTVVNSWLLRIPRDILRRRLDSEIGFAARFYQATALYLSDRLRVTSSLLGYGPAAQDSGAIDIDDGRLDQFSMGAIRFDSLLRLMSVPTVDRRLARSAAAAR